TPPLSSCGLTPTKAGTDGRFRLPDRKASRDRGMWVRWSAEKRPGTVVAERGPAGEPLAGLQRAAEDLAARPSRHELDQAGGCQRTVGGEPGAGWHSGLLLAAGVPPCFRRARALPQCQGPAAPQRRCPAFACTTGLIASNTRLG